MCHINVDICWVKLAYWCAATLASLLYGKFAVDALEVSAEDKWKIAENRSLRWHQHWLNFLGSLAGWFLAYVVIKHVLSNYDFRLSDAPLAFLAFVGMTGHLPYVVKHVWKWKFPWSSSGDPKSSKES